MTAGFGNILAEYSYNIILHTAKGVKYMSRYFETVRPRFWVLLISGLLIVALGLYAALQGYISRQNETIAALAEEYAALQEASAELEEKISYTYTDEYIEREARSKLGLIREGETLFQSSGAGEEGGQ